MGGRLAKVNGTRARSNISLRGAQWVIAYITNSSWSPFSWTHTTPLGYLAKVITQLISSSYFLVAEALLEHGTLKSDKSTALIQPLNK